MDIKDQAKSDWGDLFPHLNQEQRKMILRWFRLLAYEKKTGKSIQTLIKTAREGNKQSNRKAFFELIKLDKELLFTEWAKQIILDELEKENKIFFENLGKAIKQFPRENQNTKFIRDLKKTIIDYPYSQEILSDYQKSKEFLTLLDNEEITGDNFADIDVFRKFLRRHGLIL